MLNWPFGRPWHIAQKEEAMMDLNSLARKLAERSVEICEASRPNWQSVDWDNRTKAFEAVIREAIEKTLETADEAVYNALYDDRGPMDLRDAQALKDALKAIRSLKQSNSGMKVLEEL